MKVTAIMPTRGRPALTALAIQSFLSQTYPNKELMILDDEECPAIPACLSIPNVHIFRQGGTMNIAQKRNWLCERATGDVITHFDSDDWSAVNRIADQVNRLKITGCSVTGYHSILFYDVLRAVAVKYKGYSKFYAVGTSLAFLKSFWASNRFNENVTIGEDNKFIWAAKTQQRIVSVDGEKFIVARIHEGNTCHKDLNGCSFQPIALTDIPKEFFQHAASGEIESANRHPTDDANKG